MGRWVVRGLAVVSLLLCLASVFFGIRSYWKSDDFTWSELYVPANDPASSGYSEYLPNRIIATDRWGIFFGTIHVHKQSFLEDFGSERQFDWTMADSFRYPYLGIQGPGHFFRGLGFEVADLKEPKPYAQASLSYDVRSVTLPIPVLSLVFAILPAVVMRGFIKRRTEGRRIAGYLCVKCGYDLRGSKERCPECGEVVGARPSSS